MWIVFVNDHSPLPLIAHWSARLRACGRRTASAWASAAVINAATDLVAAAWQAAAADPAALCAAACSTPAQQHQHLCSSSGNAARDLCGTRLLSVIVCLSSDSVNHSRVMQLHSRAVRDTYLHHGRIHLHASRPWGHVGHNLGILLRLLHLLHLARQRWLRWIGPRVPHLPRLPLRPVAHGAGHGHVGHWLPRPQALIPLLPGNNVHLQRRFQPKLAGAQ